MFVCDLQQIFMNRQIPEGTQFFSLEAFNQLNFSANEDLSGLGLVEGKGVSKQYDTMVSSLSNNQKGSQKYNNHNYKVDDSCFQDFQDFIRRMPKQQQNQADSLNISSQISMFKERKLQITPSSLKEKQKYVAESNWLSQLELRCIIDYKNKKVNTVCKIRDAEMQFQNGGCAFRLSKITKMKVMFQNYQKCICFTYDELRGKKNVELKFKIFVENDIKDDLYLLFSKIIMEKLILLDYHIEKQGEDLEADKFMMAGEVYKLSQVMHHWKLRKLVLTDRIQSFKGDKCSFQMKNIKQMWTRFQTHDNNLIIKLKHGKQKTELALPMVNYPVKFCKNNWLYRIYRLLSSATA